MAWQQKSSNSRAMRLMFGTSLFFCVQVATLLKRKAGAVTLAIGDGANDVSMIQAAHIGVGISGREGRAAVQAADFAFGQFRFLVRLLLLHGRQSYLRCREVVLYAFYKNVAYVSCFVLYSFYSGERCYTRRLLA